jgi:restriction endonuclease S subunit
MFQAQIDREIMGASVHNVFPSQIEQMLIVGCDRKRQDAIANRITAELDKVHNCRVRVEAKRQQIQKLLETAVAGEALPL